MFFETNADIAKVSRPSTSAKRIGKSKENPLWATNTIFWQYAINTGYVYFAYHTREVGDVCGIADLLSSGDQPFKKQRQYYCQRHLTSQQCLGDTGHSDNYEIDKS